MQVALSAKRFQVNVEGYYPLPHSMGNRGDSAVFGQLPGISGFIGGGIINVQFGVQRKLEEIVGPGAKQDTCICGIRR